MTYTLSHLCNLGGVLAAVAQDEILTRFRRLPTVDSRRKTSAFDIVTEADEAAEAAIQAALKSGHPEAVFIGEEATSRNPGLLPQIDTADLAFVVDPLDGTKNFASGLPLFGVMAAVTVQGEIVASAIHDPIRSDTAYAFKGSGAWIESAGGTRTALRVADAAPTSQMECIVGTNFLPEPQRAQVNARLSRLGISNWFRCAAHEYRLAAGGHVHGLFYNKLMPWDHAAGWLLHREAGGWSGHFDGQPYRPSHTSGGLICTPDAANFLAMKDALLG